MATNRDQWPPHIQERYPQPGKPWFLVLVAAIFVLVIGAFVTTGITRVINPPLNEKLLAWEKEFFDSLEIPYRVIDVASGDLGASAVRKFDIEAWIPTQDAYREVTSTSNCTQFQARRLNIRYKDEKGTKPVATLNGTLVAVPRTIVAILENHQQKDGSVKVPKALIPFLGMDTLVPA